MMPHMIIVTLLHDTMIQCEAIIINKNIGTCLFMHPSIHWFSFIQYVVITVCFTLIPCAFGFPVRYHPSSLSSAKPITEPDDSSVALTV